MIHWMIWNNIPGHIKTGKSVFSTSQTHSNRKNKTTVQATVQATKTEFKEMKLISLLSVAVGVMGSGTLRSELTSSFGSKNIRKRENAISVM